jgi:signal transduction histidine kinase
VVVFVVLLYLLQRIVVGPLTILQRHAVSIVRSDDLTLRCSLQSDDEIGMLAREFDAMVERLAGSQGRLLAAARQGGMSEVASSVLHDVGQRAAGRARQPRRAGAAPLRPQARRSRACQPAAGRARPRARPLARRRSQGQQVPPFLLALSRSLVEELEGMRGDARTLASGLQHIRELLAAQQHNAGQRGALEVVEAGELLDEALRLTQDDAQPAPLLVRAYGEHRRLRAEKHKLLAILVNLVRNARQSLQEIAPRQGTITLRVEAAGLERLRIVVEDDGVGIEHERLSRVFEGGFTSKAGGHGLGLHACANGAREMEGRLWAESEGRGRGARFVLELPQALERALEPAA